VTIDISWHQQEQHYEIQAPRYRAVLVPTGVTMGIHSLRPADNPKEWIACWTKDKSYMGLKRGDRLAVLNPYHYLARNLPVGITGRELPAQHHALDKQIVIDLAPTEACAISTRLTYRFGDSPLIELEVEVRSEADYFGFELWLSSYMLGRRNQPHFWCKDRDCQASWVTPVHERFVKDFYLAFPRDNRDASLTFDGRWGPSEYQTFLNGPYYAEPLMAVPDVDGEFAYLELGRREEVSKIAGCCSGEPGPMYSDDTRFYNVLFGHDLKVAEQLHATVRAGVVPIHGEIDSVLEYRW